MQTQPKNDNSKPTLNEQRATFDRMYSFLHRLPTLYEKMVRMGRDDRVARIEEILIGYLSAAENLSEFNYISAQVRKMILQRGLGEHYDEIRSKMEEAWEKLDQVQFEGLEGKARSEAVRNRTDRALEFAQDYISRWPNV